MPAVNDEKQYATVGFDAERGAGLTGLFVVLVGDPLDRLAVLNDDVAAADRARKGFKPAFARDLDRNARPKLKRGVVDRRRQAARHGEDGAALGNLAVFDVLTNADHLAPDFPAERQLAIKAKDVLVCFKAGQRRAFAVIAREQIGAVNAWIFVNMADRKRFAVKLDRNCFADFPEQRLAVRTEADGVSAVRGRNQPPLRDENTHRHAGPQAEKVGVDRRKQCFVGIVRIFARQRGKLFTDVQILAEVDGAEQRAVLRRSGNSESSLRILARCAVFVARQRRRNAERV